MAKEYRLSYTATEIDAKLGKIDNLVATVNGVFPDENGNVEIDVSGGGANQNGLSATAANLLVTILRNGVYSTNQSANITALANELSVIEPEKILTSISVTYTGGDVEVGTVVTDLTGITVIAYYSDDSTKTVTDYSLSGEIAQGENSITVSYEGMIATFIVNGVSTKVAIRDIMHGAAVSYNENSGMYINISSSTLPRATLVPVGQYLEKDKTYKFSLNEASTNYYYGVQIFTASQSDLKFEITDETQYFDSVPTRNIDTGWIKDDYEYTVTDANQILAVNFKSNDSRTLVEDDREILLANFTIEEV